MKISVLMTCFNRRDTTLSCLKSLYESSLPEGISIQVYLVDDASTDGTLEAVISKFPLVKSERGNGTYYWNRGMHRAQEMAMADRPDYLLWLNDDTILNQDAISSLLATHEKLYSNYGHTIVVGSTVDRMTGALTYGGAVAVSSFRRFAYQKVWNADMAVECETMNGNVVLIPFPIAQAVGNVDPIFEHAMGDTDYALRARKKGFHVFVAPGYIGFCSKNKTSGSYLDRTLPLSVRWKKILSPKGLPVRSWLHFTRKHGGLLWPMYFFWPYVRLVVSSMTSFRKRQN